MPLRGRSPRLAGALLLLLTIGAATGGTLPTARPASAATSTGVDEAVRAAQVRLRAANERVDRVAVELTRGTAAWEAGRQELARTLTRAVAAARESERIAGESRQRRGALAEVAAANYRQPAASSPGLQALSAAPAGVFQALRADADLVLVRGSQGDALGAARGASLAAQDAARRARRLQDDAVAGERALTAQLAELVDLAESTNSELQAATADLDRRRAERAELVRQEAERAERAELARQDAERRSTELARQAAELARQEAERQGVAAELGRQHDERFRLEREAAARAGQVGSPAVAPALSVLPGSTAAACSGEPTDGYSNGAIPVSALCPLRYAPGHLLRADAADAFNRLTDAANASRGAPLCVTDSYRDYAGQVDVFVRKPSLAAVPGTSNHGWGVAVDFCGGVQTAGTEAYQWMEATAGRYGWVHPDWAKPGGSRPEAWHWEYVG